MHAHTDDSILRAYALYRAAAGLSIERTIREQEAEIRRMLARADRPLMEISRDDLILSLSTPMAPTTRRNRQSAYRGVFTWMQDEGFRLDNPAARLPRVKTPRREANPLSTIDLQRLVGSRIRTRTRLYALLYAYQGFRAAEISAISEASVDWDHRRILSANGKGGVEVWRPIHDLVWTELLHHRRPGFLFPGTDRGHVRPQSVSVGLSRAMRRAGIVGHRPHHMRAWFATQQLEAGVAGPIVQSTMRHANAQSLRYYFLPSEATLRAAHDALPRVHVPQPSRRRRRGASGPSARV